MNLHLIMAATMVVVVAFDTTTAVSVKSNLAIVPIQAAREIGSYVVFTCIDKSGVVEAQNVHWNYTHKSLPADANGTNVGTPRITSINGTLTIRSLLLVDSGQYVCTARSADATDKDGHPSAMAKLVVYQMPDYRQYAFSLGIFIGLLLAAAIVGHVAKVISNRVHRRQRNEARRPKVIAKA